MTPGQGVRPRIATKHPTMCRNQASFLRSSSDAPEPSVLNTSNYPA
ncbi:MAG: hypothetical protein HC945_02970 [Nitrosarchaeum sp.]|nr:hypothetical protein [Nitrosarchaeum sp.]